MVRRRLAADADPAGFAARWADADAEIAGQVADARRRLPGVRLPDAALRQIAEVCAAFDVDGMRADIVTARTALAHAAWHGRDRVTIDDVRVAARLALPHRRRRDPFDTPGLDEKRLDEALQRAQDAHPDDPDDPGPDDAARTAAARRAAARPAVVARTAATVGDRVRRPRARPPRATPARTGGPTAPSGRPTAAAAARRTTPAARQPATGNRGRWRRPGPGPTPPRRASRWPYPGVG